LINAESPVEVLGNFNEVVFNGVEEGENEELIKLIEKNLLTTEEIKYCLKDLKVLNASDFRKILKWIEKIKKLITKENEEDNTEVDETENLTETEKENLLHLEKR